MSGLDVRGADEIGGERKSSNIWSLFFTCAVFPYVAARAVIPLYGSHA